MKKLIIAIIAIALIGAGIYYLNQDTSVGTSDWKTHTNEEYGFEFKYPPTWFINKDYPMFLYDRMVGPELPAVNKIIDFLPSVPGNFSTSSWKFSEYNRGPGEIIDISANYLSGNLSNIYQVSTKTIDRNPVWSSAGCEPPCSGPEKNIEYRIVTTYIPRENATFVIKAKIIGGADMSPAINLEEEAAYLEIYQKIIPTIKFIK